jgi:hypothetical protein
MHHVPNPRAPMDFWVAILSFWSLIAGVTAWASFALAKSSPRSTSWMKMMVAGTMLLAFAVVPFVPPKVHGEGYFAVAIIFLFFWPMMAFGAALCCGVIVGASLALWRARNDAQS